MANLISRATGNWLTASTWGLADTTSKLISQAGNAVVPTSAGSTARSSGFTPGAITIDGIAIKLGARTGTTGTMTVELWNNTLSAVVAATTVTINVSDLPAATVADVDGGWRVFQFASVVLLAGNEYMVQCTTSSASQVTLFTDATTNNWSRLLRTTTTQAPAAGDDMLVAGEHTGAGTNNAYTVTMNSTSATDYGSGVADGSSITPALAVSCFGTLTNGTAAATNYILRLSGNLANFRDGTINIGTVATPIPRDSTAVVEFDCAADADFGWHNHGGTCNIQGLSRTSGKNVVSCKLNTDEAAAQTVLGVDTDTGWLSGDQIIIAATGRTIGESESRTLSANASAMELTISSGLTNAHSGTSPTQAEVINLTRNVKIRSVSSAAMTFFHSNQTAIVDVDWAEFSNLGNDTVLDWRGVTVMTTTGSFNMQFCSLHDFEAHGFYARDPDLANMTFSNNVLWKMALILGVAVKIFPTTNTSWVVDRNIVIGDGSGTNTTQGGFVLLDIGGTFTNNTAASIGDTTQAGNAYAAEYSEDNAVFGTFSDNVYHSSQTGIKFSNNLMSGTIRNVTIWRNTESGMIVYFANGLILDGFVLFGNGSHNILLVQSPTTRLTLKNLTANSDSTFTTTNGIGITPNSHSGIVILDSCSFSVVSGIKTAHTNDIHFFGTGPYSTTIFLRNTILAAATPVKNQDRLTDQVGFVISQRHGQTVGNNSSWFKYGTLSTDSAISNTALPSLRMTPNNASNKLISATIDRGIQVAVNNGGAITARVFTRKSTAGDGAAYNGTQPRLIQRANVLMGIAVDVVLDTHTAAAGTWEQLSGTTAAVTDDGVCEFVVDCDGTVGWINVDDWSVV